MIDELNTLLIGNSEEKELHFICAHYAMGDPFSMIAAEFDISEEKVRTRTSTQLGRYEEIKKQREVFTGIQLKRSLSLVDA